MPGLPSAQSGLQGAFNDQVVHANTTLNAFVGGKQKAWMLNASPVQPSRRPPPPRPQQAQDPTSQLPTTPANVLPSPAPSEEPSPAVSNPRDSPNPRTLSVTTAPQRQTARQVQTAQPAGLADLHSHSGDTAQALTEAVAEGPDRPPTADNAMADRPNFKPVTQKGGIEALKPDVERPRFQILRDACDRKDNFYITLHQLYCLWSIDHQIASNLLLCDPESVRIGFGILESVLKKNAGFSKSNLLWCARFPGRSLEQHRNPTVNQVAAFLSSLSQHWTSLHDNLFNRLYPYLMDELVGKLQCYSTVLQKILFTAARRRLGVSDGPLGLEIDNYFVQDQEDHFINGQYRTFVSPNDPDGLEQRNAPLILCYLNKLKVAMTSAAPHKKPRRFQMAVEILETHSHSQVLKHVWANGLADREETMEKIRKRVNAVPEEDGIAVIDRTGTTTSELSIDLTDPFSASIFAVPARGVTCTHMECFDLETWLNTRPTKQAIRCGHQKVCTCPKYAEPSDPDKWKCPICFADARPRSLRIDRFLLDVRRRLEELNKLDTKSILVSIDGTWRPVAELVDDDDAGSDGDGPANRGPVTALRKEPSKSASVERAVEVIEID
ncbi:hypothetical protein VSDG_07417 [Cytospora chrysosperma]|uniref:Uncharacterized protein n=1 Tax=Cytospora chrysosperma TaxID=252740 RepID=A0A423VHU5_CYTCH|nr:hypothetical protein VSDG_07417 [Valsa sordida]